MRKKTISIMLFGMLLLSLAISSCDKNNEPPTNDSTSGAAGYTEQDWEW
jgi:hypothetical protein